MPTGDKVVQTKIPRHEYERLVEIAERQGKSIKQVLRDAAKRYSDEHMRHDPNDPLFSVDPATGGTETDARNTDDLLADSVEKDTDA